MARETRATWARRVREWKRSGLDAREFGAREGIQPERIWWWSWRLGYLRRTQGQRPAFVEVEAPPVPEVATSPVAMQNALEVAVGQMRVVVPTGFDEETLRRLLRVMGER